MVGSSPSPRRAWIEIVRQPQQCGGHPGSPSPRRAWIEIWPDGHGSTKTARVALPTEGVDRNNINAGSPAQKGESPSPRRAWIEIVRWPGVGSWSRVALPTEGVDRNKTDPHDVDAWYESPSPRRAWIEMIPPRLRSPTFWPSPSPRRAWIEIGGQVAAYRLGWSPSPRRAWIEIRTAPAKSLQRQVALPTEGVDRNIVYDSENTGQQRRPPHGGRG